MKIEEQTIRAAFAQHGQQYDQRGRAWSNPHHVEMWRMARRAFDGPSFADFEKLYTELRGTWQVFRGSVSFWTPQQLFDALAECDPSLQRKKLSSLSETDAPTVWSVLDRIKSLKVNKWGASVVAMSKFLHFWNPRLFVIVDDAVIWKWVLSHAWLRRQVEETRIRTDQQLFQEAKKHDDTACDMATYVAILTWAAGLVRRNPVIAIEFAQYVKESAKDTPVPDDLAEYEAAAVEWFLLGLVELPPAGVHNLDSRTVTN